MEKEKDWYSKKIGLRFKDMKNLNFIIRTLQNKVCQQFCEFDNLQIFRIVFDVDTEPYLLGWHKWSPTVHS